MKRLKYWHASLREATLTGQGWSMNVRVEQLYQQEADKKNYTDLGSAPKKIQRRNYVEYEVQYNAKQPPCNRDSYHRTSGHSIGM